MIYSLFSPPLALKRVIRNLLILSMGFLLAPSGQAIEFKTTNHYTLTEAEAVSEETWVLAEQVTVAGSMTQDSFFAAGQLQLDGQFHKDLWALGGSVDVTGKVKDSLRIAGGLSARIDGHVGKDLMAISQTVQFDTNATVAGSAYFLGDQVIVRGRIDESLHIIASRATLGGTIHGSVQITAKDIILLPDTHIDGDFIYTLPRELLLSDQVHLNGTLERRPLSESASRSFTSSLMIQGLFLMGSFLTGLFFIALFPRQIGEAVFQARFAPGRSMLIGLGAVALTFMLAFLGSATLIGLPLVIILAALTAIHLYLGKHIVALLIAGAIFRTPAPTRFMQVASGLFIGLLILYAAFMIPSLGFALWMVTATWGLGATLISLLQRQRHVAPPPLNPLEQSPHDSQDPPSTEPRS